jgi:hypothetical protein
VSLREQILASQGERKPEPLEVPEWHATVWLKQMTVADQVALSEGTKPADMPVAVLLHCLVDENGERIFTDDDREALAGESFAIVLRVFVAAAKLNGLSTAELDEAMQSFDRARAEPADNGSRSLSG